MSETVETLVERARHGDLAAARDEHARLRNAKPASTPHRSPPGFTAREHLKSAGFATPEAAVETWLWAGKEGNLDLLMMSLAPQNPKRLELEKMTADQREEERKQIQAALQATFNDFAVVRREQPGEGHVVLHLRSSLTTNEISFRFLRSGGEWKLADKKF